MNLTKTIVLLCIALLNLLRFLVSNYASICKKQHVFPKGKQAATRRSKNDIRIRLGLLLLLQLCGGERVVQKHGDGQQADAARYGR
jgi:hypothetical protein